MDRPEPRTPAGSARSTSLTVITTAALLALLTLLLGLFGGLDLVAERRRLEASLQRGLEVDAAQLAEALALSAWNLDDAQLARNLESAMQDETVAAVAVTVGDLRLARARDAEGRVVPVAAVAPQPGWLMTRREVLHQGRPVGMLQAWATPRFAEEKLQQARAARVRDIALLDVVLCAAAIVFLRGLVLTPLARLERYARAVAAGGAAPRAMPARGFHGELETLRAAVERMVGLLEARYGELAASGAALARSEARLRLLLDSTGEAIYGTDLEGRCTFANRTCLRLLGYSDPGALLGRDMHATIHRDRSTGAETPPSTCALREAARRGERAYVPDEVLWRADGTSFPAECWSHPQLEEGAVTGAVVTFVDATERRRLEQQLIQARKMESIGRLAGGVAHDFNNMLSVILGYTRLALDELPRSDPGREAFEGIAEAAERSRELTRQLLAFSRKEVIRPRPVDLAALVAHAERSLGRLIGEDVQLVVRAPPGLWRVRADPGQLDQILMNLAVNAREAMPGGGRLTIALSNVAAGAGPRPGEWVRLTVQDTGQGMDRETREHLFEPFYTTKEMGRGTGLGLAMVYGIVAQNGGSIECESEPGRGATFRIDLPRDTSEAEPQAAATQPAPAPATAPAHRAGRGRVVEDEELVLRVTTRTLERMGYSVIPVASAREAVARCEQGEPFDLVLTDVIMPEMNGVELAGRLRAVRPDARVVFMSGYTAEVMAQRGLLEEGIHFVQKPPSPTQLREALRRAMGAV